MWLILFKRIELTLQKGTILTQEMLGELQAFPKDILNIWYDRYPDGILTGTDLIETTDDTGKIEVWISKGLIRHCGCIYRMSENINLSQCIKEWTRQGRIQEQVLYKLVFVPGKQVLLGGRNTQILYPVELTVCSQSEETEGIFYARFKMLEKGKVALFHDVDREDISKATYWNMTDCPYACRGGITYHPYIFENVKRMLSSKKRKSQLDYIILNEINRTGTVNIELIQMILKDRQVKICLGDRAYLLKQFMQVMMEDRKVDSEADGIEREEVDEEEGRMLPD